jgi:hypothetical protein
MLYYLQISAQLSARRPNFDSKRMTTEDRAVRFAPAQFERQTINLSFASYDLITSTNKSSADNREPLT